MSESPWFHHDPGRAQRELDALRAAGLAWDPDDAAFTRGVWAGTTTIDGPTGPVRLRATYPDEFPYFPPQVNARDIALAHHQAPTGELCLLPPDGTGWRPSDTLAELLVDQWPKVLATNVGDGTDGHGCLLETDQAEPWTAYLPTTPGQAVLLPAGVTPPTGAGTAHYRCTRTAPMALTVISMRDAAGLELVDNFVVHSATPTGGTYEARWIRLTDPPTRRDAAGLWQAVLDQEPSLANGPWTAHPAVGAVTPKQFPFVKQQQVVLVCVQEETSRRHLGDGWVALVRTRPNSRKPPSPVSAVRVARAGRDELYQRAPELRGVGDKSISSSAAAASAPRSSPAWPSSLPAALSSLTGTSSNSPLPSGAARPPASTASQRSSLSPR